ncbi:NFX1-type zinc finger-containing protein 1-like protein, partial [Dinothrombium tinctorium]
MLTLQNKGFLQLLETDVEIKDYLMADIISALVKVCESDSRELLIQFLTKVNSAKKFFLLHVIPFIEKIKDRLRTSSLIHHSRDDDEKYLKSIENLVFLLRKLQITFPKTSDVSSLTTLLLSATDQINHKSQLISTEILSLLKQIQDEDNLIRFNCIMDSKKKDGEISKPPNDFRSISIIPTYDDIHSEEKPFLRKNLINGMYEDVDHYLDVQFRLLREDFVRPLRIGISEFLKQRHKKETRINDVLIYYDVRILNTELKESGLVCKCSFNISPLRRVRWQVSKRLMAGSLLCLSSDNFKTMFFGTVYGKRKPEQLEKGLFDLLLEVSNTGVLDIFYISSSNTMVMIESQAYFEAYRHNLIGLQQFSTENFPLKDHIIDVRSDILPPNYLRDYISYNLTHFMNPIMQGNENNFTDNRSIKFDSSLERKLQNVVIMNERAWPSFDDLNLDESQFEALRGALTRRLAIIQGPPGTGKTFVGLRIVQTLLKNSHYWNQTDSPILIVCYTNHALDQFLEGMLPFCDSIIRIGGRCQSEALQEKCLNYTRELRRCERLTPDYLHHGIRDCKTDLYTLTSYLNQNLLRIAATRKKLLPLEAIDIFNDRLDCKFFRYSINNFRERESFLKFLQLWLGLGTSITVNDQIETNSVENEEIEDPIDEEQLEEVENSRFDYFSDEDESFDKINDDKTSKKELIKLEFFDSRPLMTEQFSKYFRKMLKSENIMSVEEAREVKNINSLNIEDRW